VASQRRLDRLPRASREPLDNGQQGWLVHRDYDARLREQPGKAEAPDLSGYTARQQRMAWARWRCVCRFREAKQTHGGPVSCWLPALVEQLKREVAEPLAANHGDKFSVSRRSLYEWDGRAATVANLANLVDRRGKESAGRGSESFWKYFGALYLTDDRRTAKTCWRKARERAAVDGAESPSYQYTMRRLDERFPPAVQAAYRYPKQYRDQVEPTAQLHPETFAVGERWESDQRTCDVRVVMPDGSIGRPVLTAWIDWRSRRCMGHRVEPYGDSETIAASLHSGLTSEANLGGPPRIAWVDNGVDYLSVAGRSRSRKLSKADEVVFRGTLELLGIELHLALPRGPRGKARIERWFQTKGRQLDAFLPGYVGNEPANRPESLAALEKDPSNLMTLAEYRRRVDAYVAEFNASADHDKADLADESGVKLSPDEAYRRWCPERRVYLQPKMLKHLLRKWDKPVPVTKQGVRVTVDGQSYHYGATEPALIPYRAGAGRRRKGKRVFVSYDPQDVGHVYLWEAIERDGAWEIGPFICTAELNHAGGAYGTEANRRQMKQVARDRRKFNKAVKAYREGAPEQLMRPENRLVLTAHRERVERDGRGDDPDPPLPIKPVTTPIDDQADAVARAELRQAAGGETGQDQPRPRVNMADALSRMDAMGGRDRGERPKLRLSEALGSGDQS